MTEDLEKKIVQRLDRVIEKIEMLMGRMGDDSAVLHRLDRIEKALISSEPGDF